MEQETANYHKPSKEDKGAWLKEINLTRLESSGLTYTLVKNGDVAVFRHPGSFTVDFFTRKNRWKVRGNSKSTHGSVGEFLTWFKVETGQST